MSSYPRVSNLYSSIGTASTGVVVSYGAAVLAITAINVSGTDCFLLFYDRNTAPSIANIPILSVPVYKNNGYTELNTSNLGVGGLVFDLGICWAFSTSASSYVPAAPTDGVISIRWV